MTKIWGLTGGIATGKSTVSSWLKQAGLPVIDADVLARQVVAPQTKGLQQIVTAFGSEYLLTDGSLDRHRLGQLVFHHPEQLARLDAITTPLIRQAILQQIHQYRSQNVPVVIIDAPTLFEVGYLEDLVDAIMVVTTTPARQRERLMARNDYSIADAQARIDQQWPLARKVARADVVIDNDGDITQTRQQVVKWLDTNNFGKTNQLK